MAPSDLPPPAAELPPEDAELLPDIALPAALLPTALLPAALLPAALLPAAAALDAVVLGAALLPAAAALVPPPALPDPHAANREDIASVPADPISKVRRLMTDDENGPGGCGDIGVS
ncbi:MAG: hypothetical protein M3Z00_10520 [Actinomycetota bacterium]|nr:hypothetical protein [Actinomycetota bacterium]